MFSLTRNLLIVTSYFRLIKKDPKIVMDIEWTKPVETYGELKGYRVRYGLRGQRLTEILITDPEVQHQGCH